MDPAPLLDRILDDEGLIAGLDEAEATQLIRALSDRVRKIASGTANANTARQKVEGLCSRARQIAATTRASSNTAQTMRQLVDEWPV